MSLPRPLNCPPPGSRRLAQAAAGAVLAAAAGLLLAGSPSSAASALLESVKQNPKLARRLCDELRQLNARGIRASSSEAVAMVARRQGLSSTDAEILTTYVVGLHCPDVR